MNWLNEDGTFNKEFLSEAPEEIREVVERKNFNHIADGYKSYKGVEKYVGSDPDQILKLPTDPNSEEWSKVYERLGRPSKAEEYEFKPAEDDPQISDSLLNGFKELSYQNGKTQRQFENDLRFQLDAAKEMAKSLEQQREEAIEQGKQNLLQEAGSESKYNTMTQNAVEVMDKFGVTEVLREYGLEYDTRIVNMLNEFKMVGQEDKLPGNSQPPQSSNNRLDEITKLDSFRDNMHPDHDKVMAEFRAIHGI